jgi:hypothetical membrane protein
MAISTAFKLSRLGMVAAAALAITAMPLYPGGTALNRATRGYSFFHNSLSDLGRTVAWNGEANPGSLFLAAASLIFVLAGIACFVALLRTYRSLPVTDALARAAGAAVLLASVGLVGAALMPQDRDFALHSRMTLLAVGSFPVATALLAAATALNEHVRRRAAIGWLVLTSVVVAWAFVMPMRPTTDRELAIPVTLQKIVAIALIVTLTFESLEAERLVAANAVAPGAV